MMSDKFNEKMLSLLKSDEDVIDLIVNIATNDNNNRSYDIIRSNEFNNKIQELENENKELKEKNMRFVEDIKNCCKKDKILNEEIDAKCKEINDIRYMMQNCEEAKKSIDEIYL